MMVSAITCAVIEFQRCIAVPPGRRYCFGGAKQNVACRWLAGCQEAGPRHIPKWAVRWAKLPRRRDGGEGGCCRLPPVRYGVDHKTLERRDLAGQQRAGREQLVRIRSGVPVRQGTLNKI